MNLEALQMAMKTLKGSSLKMWLYLNKNKERFTFELSRAACLEWGIKKDSYIEPQRIASYPKPCAAFIKSKPGASSSRFT
jgi:hypothetical protein